MIKNCNLLIARAPNLQEKPSALKREHPALQNMTFLYIFLFLWVILPSWIRIRIQQLKLMQIHEDLDLNPMPWPQHLRYELFGSWMSLKGFNHSWASSLSKLAQSSSSR
jgi:hypothetical protein